MAKIGSDDWFSLAERSVGDDIFNENQRIALLRIINMIKQAVKSALSEN